MLLSFIKEAKNHPEKTVSGWHTPIQEEAAGFKRYRQVDKNEKDEKRRLEAPVDVNQIAVPSFV
ncbi:MAG: hypothetical protein K0R19_3197 [Bacillota bacterium]|jgi:hypothetical protein|nr:hypothetical protein [Bacillota bacterium]